MVYGAWSVSQAHKWVRGWGDEMKMGHESAMVNGQQIFQSVEKLKQKKNVEESVNE